MSRESLSRFIPVEEIERVQDWQFAAIDSAAQVLALQAREREAQQAAAALQAQREQAWSEGFDAGSAHGRAQAQDELQQQMRSFLDTQARQAGQDLSQRVDGLVAQAAQQFAQGQQQLAQQVLELACALARQVLCRELALDAQGALPVIRAALDALGHGHAQASLRLHPQDIEAIGAQLDADAMGVALKLRADADIAPGGCVLESQGSTIDANVAQRWRRVVASLGLDLPWDACTDGADAAAQAAASAQPVAHERSSEQTEQVDDARD